MNQRINVSYSETRNLGKFNSVKIQMDFGRDINDDGDGVSLRRKLQYDIENLKILVKEELKKVEEGH